ncbi:IS5 family transposase OrfA [Myxococcus stipitatus DSM 14675]|uniref:IS5 family transposase OrfA n=1 Tax=Myxococcus stipitatus (strain DSM 14675 / JCM 12634 / Mx s8) TaxID=1278073 RepID=L7UBM2_MYXSD|nr:IS5 family transposase OrfA [Myxococcus stipitatus DSM 14675]
MSRGEFTDAQWERLVGLLPPQRPARGRPNKDHRVVLNGICWVLRTGVPWREVPRERFGSWKTLSSRFYRWQEAGVWARILRQLQAEANEDGRLDWTLHYVDASVVRAHQHAAGARGTPRKGGRQKRSGAAKGASRPSSMSEPRDGAAPSSLY